MYRLAMAAAALAALIIFAEPLAATRDAAAAEREKTAEKQREPEKLPQAAPAESTTRHRVRVGGKEIGYTATAGELPVTNDAGETEAAIFYVAYRADRAKESKPRPLLFIFNGGPGAASVWLHLGAIGPRRVQMLPYGGMPAPPFRLVDNAYTWLDQADLVFVDPVGTGYSRPSKPDLLKNFNTVRGDIDSLSKFVRLYLTRNQLWSAPVFLVGESYGTFRCSGLSENLIEHGVALNGIVLISSILNFETISFDNGNDLPYSLFLPSYAATAWYHKRLAPELQNDLERTLAETENWAATGYQQALYKGDRLTAEERRAVADKLAGFTGLSRRYIEEHNLRVDNRSFARELLRDRGLMTGLMDSRFTIPDVEQAGPGFDATIAVIRPPFTATVNSYLRDELDYHSDLEYYTLGGGIGRWDWETKNAYADTSDNLRNSLAKNPYMRVLVASGYFDLATPHFATEYTFSHLGIPPELKKNISFRSYRSGHMMYLDEKVLAQLKKDAAEFIGTTLK